MRDLQNPYESPTQVGDSHPRRFTTRGFIRVLAGTLAVSGAIYLPLLLWIFLIPGGLIWLGWVLIAFRNDRDLADSNWFWGFSLVWNAGWLVFAISEYEPGRASILLVHCVAAVLFSATAILLNFTYSNRAEQISL